LWQGFFMQLMERNSTGILEIMLDQSCEVLSEILPIGTQLITAKVKCCSKDGEIA
jgi:hypothetical protein